MSFSPKIFDPRLALRLLSCAVLATGSVVADDTNDASTIPPADLFSVHAPVVQLRSPLASNGPTAPVTPAAAAASNAAEHAMSADLPGPVDDPGLDQSPAKSEMTRTTTATVSAAPVPTAISTSNTTPVAPSPSPAPSAPPAPSTPAPVESTSLATMDDPLPLPLASEATSTSVPDAPAPSAPAPSAADGTSGAWKNSYVNLINLLVNRGVLTKKDSGDLITQAEHDASQAEAARTQASATLAAQAPANPDDDTMRVGYVPETVKEQMRDEIRDDVLKQARDENWAAPNSVPDWVTRYHVVSDLRFRYEGQTFPDGNDDTGSFHNFNAINTGSPFDIGSASIAQNPPYYNVNENRDRFRVRARIGADATLGQGFSAGMRIATGSDDSPVSENQTLGAANNAQGGNFSKYSVWLDRAFLKYQLNGKEGTEEFSAMIGRFDNPFFSSNMLWANDLGFDGIAVKGKYEITDGLTPFVTAGAFPVYNTDLNFGTYNAAKFNSENKWLYAAQVGVDRKITDNFSFKGAVAYYDFENIQGQVSDAFTPQFSTDSGDTDDSRPAFAQNGNTYIALRNITPNATNDFGTINQWQYFGLATPFHELAITDQFDYSGFAPIDVSLIGEFVKNMAFNSGAIESNGPPLVPGPVNNLSNGTFVGGGIGYNIGINVGHPALTKLWDWNLSLTYRYLQSDAVVDGFNDSDFGGNLAGTNLQGYMIVGSLALTPRVWTSVRWMSANSIAGPTYKNDLIQVDVNAKF